MSRRTDDVDVLIDRTVVETFVQPSMRDLAMTRGTYRVASVRIKRRRGRQPVVVAELAPTDPGEPPMTYRMPAPRPIPAPTQSRTLDEMALAAMLSPDPQRALAALTAAQRAEHTCPDCGDNGATRHNELAYSCRACGVCFDAER